MAEYRILDEARSAGRRAPHRTAGDRQRPQRSATPRLPSDLRAALAALDAAGLDPELIVVEPASETPRRFAS